jgi:sialidase-1
MLNLRNEDKRHRRLVSFSDDGVSGWSRPAFDDTLVEPICMASIIRYNHGGQNVLLFANPNNPTGRERKNVSIRLSRDDGKTWPIVKSLEPGPSGYSDLAVGPDGTIYCFYERGAAKESMYRTRTLCVARFNLQWVTE